MTPPARPVTMPEVLARQIAGLRSQCDAVLATMAMMQQQTEAANEEKPKRAMLGQNLKAEDPVERIKKAAVK